MPPKKIPMRMCVGCREMHPKKELLRIVRTSDGKTVADSTGKVSGRGAYICPKKECFDKARKIRGIERALEVDISDEVFESLREGIDESDR
ncbi:MAG: YlxR family protein [Clostridia bacterium]|nr:YlxR family protein [Clostridia bacterium]